MTSPILTHTKIKPRFLSPALAQKLAQEYGSPTYVYDEVALIERAAETLQFQAPFGLTVRYAMKANPIAAILRLFNSVGLHIDASSEPEVYRAIKSGIEPSRIMLTSQQLPSDMKKIVELGVIYNATSLRQLGAFGQNFPGNSVSIRLNMGLGSGYSRSVSVAGPLSSFGIWHEQAESALDIASKYDLKITTVHSHIGCGNDSAVWTESAKRTLSLLEQFPSVKNLNLGGGFKVARMPYESATDLKDVSSVISELLEDFNRATGRKLHLEIEPGTYLVANAGSLLTTVQDIVSTGKSGHDFIKLDTGMNDILRPCLHGSQHPISILTNSESETEYIIVGHNCESTDLLTPDSEDPEVPLPRLLPTAAIGDLVVIDGAGAYCSAMRAIGYNSFATPNEVLLAKSGQFELINRSVNIDTFTASEIYL